MPLNREDTELMPQRHLKQSLFFLVIAAVWSYQMSWLKFGFCLLMVLFGGVLIDADHVTVDRVKRKITGGEKGPTIGWVNYFHALPGAIFLNVIFIILFIFYHPVLLAIIAYWFHILMDARCREVMTHDHSPLPKFIHPRLPERWKCSFYSNRE